MKKSLTLKRTLLVLACLAMVLVAGVTLAACGGPGTNDYITEGENASFSNSDVKFNNASDFQLVYQGNNHYIAQGTAAIMDKDQAAAWGTVEGSKYVVVNVKMGAGSTSIVGWRNAETKDTAFTQKEINGSLIKNSSAKNETKNYILALSDGETPRHEDLQIWRIEVTPATEEGAEAQETIVYTIDFSALYTTNAE